jgi:hypothetical protein
VERLVGDGKLWSVREVLKELDVLCRHESVIAWAHGHRSLFRRPSTEEMALVTEILAVPGFDGLVKLKSITRGTPVADPFLIAAAKVYGGCVVTMEEDRPGAKIPHVCKHFHVDCTNLRGFFKREQINPR